MLIEIPDYQPDDLLTTAQLAQAIPLASKTLLNMRANGQGPAYSKNPGKYSGRVLYRWSDVCEWLAARGMHTLQHHNEATDEGRAAPPPLHALDELISTRTLSQRTGVSEWTWKMRRVNGDGPPYRKLGPRAVRYVWGEFLDWANEGKRISTSST